MELASRPPPDADPPPMVIEENVPLAPLTTFRIGGPARFLVRARSAADVAAALALARERDCGLLVLGGGSNVLIDDAGFGGLALKLELLGVEWKEDGLVRAAAGPDTNFHVAKRGSLALGEKDNESMNADNTGTSETSQGHDVKVSVGAGENWDALVSASVARGLWGLENLSGIPGSVGGAPVQNIGAYGAELKDVLESVEVLDRETGEVTTLGNEACGFTYRSSIFKRNPGRYVVLAITLKLSREAKPNLSYRDLALAFAGKRAPALADIRGAVLAIRARKFPDLAKEGTAGSFFLNPVVSRAKAAELGALFPGVPMFPAQNGAKLSLAFILDRLGMKGVARGGARLFENQPLVVVAARNSSARDVLALARDVSTRVHDACGVEIEKEVNVVLHANSKQ